MMNFFSSFWRRLAILWVCSPGALFPSGTEAEPSLTDFQHTPAMRVVIVRDADPSCEPNCAEWISAEGFLHDESADEFRKALNAMGKRKLPVLISSGGGAIEAALAIGRMIHVRQLDVAVSKTDFKPCDAQPSNCGSSGKALLRGEPHSRGAFCASACTFILAAGARRYVTPWSYVGVHQTTQFMKFIKRTVFVRVRKFMTPDQRIITEKSIVGEKNSSRIIKLDAPTAETDSKIRAYLTEMGLPDGLQKLAAATPPQSMHWLTHAEQNSTRIATDYYGGENLIAEALAGGSNLQKASLPTRPDRSDVNAAGEVTSLAYGSLKVPSFADHDSIVSLEFLHRKDASDVEMTALVEERSGFIPTANLSLVLVLGTQRFAVPAVASSTSPTRPLITSIPLGDLCKIRVAGFIKVTLMQVTYGAKISGPPAFFDLRNLSAMPDLLADICKPDASAAARKLDRLWH